MLEKLNTENFISKGSDLNESIDYAINLTNAFEKVDLGQTDVIKFLEFVENSKQNPSETTEKFLDKFTEVLQQSQHGIENLLSVLTKITESLI